MKILATVCLALLATACATPIGYLGWGKMGGKFGPGYGWRGMGGKYGPSYGMDGMGFAYGSGGVGGMYGPGYGWGRIAGGGSYGHAPHPPSISGRDVHYFYWSGKHQNISDLLGCAWASWTHPFRKVGQSVLPHNQALFCYYVKANDPQRGKMYLLTYTPNKDKSALHPRSLIRVFVVRMKKCCILGYPKCA